MMWSRENIRNIREQVKTLKLKKENLKDKVDIQKDFINKIESQSKDDIKTRMDKIETLNQEMKDVSNRVLNKKKYWNISEELKTVEMP